MFYSIIIPVYNRPDHMEKLLNCLTRQSFRNFEVIVVESGSNIKSDEVVHAYEDRLNIKYIYKSNEGQGFSRNRGMQEASGDYFIIFDSDILVPEDYVEIVDSHLKNEYLDAYGGPDRLHPESTPFQTAVDFCMTSFLTTGGTRGNKKNIGTYHPRSFNMGVSREVYEKTNGFKIPFLGEDIEWSARIIAQGYKTGLIEDAHIYHERKNSLKGFYKQLHFFGRGRVNINKLIPGSMKLTHFVPVAYCLYVLVLLFLLLVSPATFRILALPLAIYNLLVMITAGIEHKSVAVALSSLVLTNVLMLAYGTGMIRETFKLYVLRKEQTYVP